MLTANEEVISLSNFEPLREFWCIHLAIHCPTAPQSQCGDLIKNNYIAFYTASPRLKLQFVIYEDNK